MGKPTIATARAPTDVIWRPRSNGDDWPEVVGMSSPSWHGILSARGKADSTLDGWRLRISLSHSAQQPRHAG